MPPRNKGNWSFYKRADSQDKDRAIDEVEKLNTRDEYSSQASDGKKPSYTYAIFNRRGGWEIWRKPHA